MDSSKIEPPLKAPQIRLIADLALFAIFSLSSLLVVCFLIVNSPPFIRRLASAVTGVRWGMTTANYSNKATEVKSLQNDSLDVLFMGSSHAYRTFDTQFFDSVGVRAFNLGTSAETPINSIQLLTGTSHYLKARTVILELYPRVFTMDGVEAYMNLLNGMNEYLPDQAKTAFLLRDRRTILCYLGRRLALGEPYVTRTKTDVYVKGGFVRNDMIGKLGNNRLVIPEKVNEAQFEACSQMIEVLQQRKVEMVAVIVPIPALSPETKVQYDKLTKRIAEMCRIHHVKFIDFNQFVSYPAEYFYDADHLNYTGVQAFLPFFTQKMRDMNVHPFSHAMFEEP